MLSFEDVLKEFEDFLQTAPYLEVLQELYDTLENDLTIEKEVQNPQRD